MIRKKNQRNLSKVELKYKFRRSSSDVQNVTNRNSRVRTKKIGRRLSNIISQN